MQSICQQYPQYSADVKAQPTGLLNIMACIFDFEMLSTALHLITPALRLHRGDHVDHKMVVTGLLFSLIHCFLFLPTSVVVLEVRETFMIVL